jgi:hypothetical protein
MKRQGLDLSAQGLFGARSLVKTGWISSTFSSIDKYRNSSSLIFEKYKPTFVDLDSL